MTLFYVERIITTYDRSGGYECILRGRRGSKGRSIVLVSDFDGDAVIDPVGVKPDEARQIWDAVASQNLSPEGLKAYGIYNGDLEGPERGVHVDWVDATVD